MPLFRSEEMTLCQLFLQSEAAYACVAELGELGLAQFRDLNPDVSAFQRKFVNEVRRCDEMERKLRYLEKEIKRDDIPILDTGENPEAPQPREMIDLEAAFEKLENELREVNQNSEALKKNFLELTELKHILRKTQTFFDEMAESGHEDEHANLLGDDGLRAGGQVLKLGFVAGVILRERLPAFERMLWRACRGNVFLRQAEIDAALEDPVTGDQVYKSVFIIFFQGDQLKTRVKKICEGFRATLYPCPETPAERREMAIGVMTRIEDLNTVLGQTQDHRHRVLVAAAKNIKNWFVKVRKIKSIYHTLNLFNLDVTQKCLIAECWIPVTDMETIQMSLRRGTERSGSSVPPILNRMMTREVPPTYNRTNKFTAGFQNLVDAYGVATYREVNPASFTIVSFPFLFSMMFGDAGHGLLMTLFALWMVVKEKPLAAKKIQSEIWVICFAGRYIMLLMGLFSIYAGFIYNDVFSKGVNIFGSAYKVNLTDHELQHHHSGMLVPNEANNHYRQTPYPFGVDPIWMMAENKIPYLNAYKMKISIIFGVVHMGFGVILGIWNHRFFGRNMNILVEFVPQIIFLIFLFGYLCILMFIKWTKYYAGAEDQALTPGCAPSILITFIGMVLFKYDTVALDGCENYMYPGQETLQKVMIITAVLVVPILLFGKPILFKMEMNKAKNHATLHNHNGTAEGEDVEVAGVPQTENHEGGDEPHEFSDVMIHQAIHTIEYVLGSVSHTASYLRLWALSLAHSQLSEVLWLMVLRKGLMFQDWYGGVILYFIFAAWAALTVSILVLMEGLSAFLHTLRLHWVEFQSKFYAGAGYLFVPFSFENIMEVQPGEE
ncbi:V-type proton ATPase 116 kDa subunit a1-like isoform X3 [Daphnia pulex]|uniref:V-type proton ATPase 116 kDa subunit a1-like isoform X3 n=1 Tax=Daphnia pulex TaxID=6669 RepID=UPI001EDE46A3|nr:V-type proton ATPase 116 kDa subunit a1-like isoform X3 [Daphnia pulex]XP_046653327.1 V-type proton ATPase 116 kDa subunit a1-like isoform X3 [Daphnia pulicaria]